MVGRPYGHHSLGKILPGVNFRRVVGGVGPALPPPPLPTQASRLTFPRLAITRLPSASSSIHARQTPFMTLKFPSRRALEVAEGLDFSALGCELAAQLGLLSDALTTLSPYNV